MTIVEWFTRVYNLVKYVSKCLNPATTKKDMENFRKELITKTSEIGKQIVENRRKKYVEKS